MYLMMYVLTSKHWEVKEVEVWFCSWSLECCFCNNQLKKWQCYQSSSQLPRTLGLVFLSHLFSETDPLFQVVQDNTICYTLPQFTCCRGSHPWHACMFSLIGLHRSTFPCPWLNMFVLCLLRRGQCKFSVGQGNLFNLWNFFDPMQFV